MYICGRRKINDKNMLNINFTQTSETIKLFNTKGDVLYSLACNDNTVRKTLESACKDCRTIMNGLIIVGADLSGADLTGLAACDSKFIDCDFSGAKLNGSFMPRSTFMDCIFMKTEIIDASLEKCTFNSCIFRSCIFDDSMMSRAHAIFSPIVYCSFKDVKYFKDFYFEEGIADKQGKITQYYPLACPSDGAFIGWKKIFLDNNKQILIKLEIPEDAKRTSSGESSRKCRCDKAKVLEITDMETGVHLHKVTNETGFMGKELDYIVGETVYPDSFDENRWNLCTHGLHFFINKQDAIDY